jgi:hypothetical protein
MSQCHMHCLSVLRRCAHHCAEQHQPSSTTVLIWPMCLTKPASSTPPANIVKTATQLQFDFIRNSVIILHEQQNMNATTECTSPFTSHYFSDPTHSFILRFPLSSYQQQLPCNEVFDPTRGRCEYFEISLLCLVNLPLHIVVGLEG